MDVNGGMLCLVLCELHPENMLLNEWQYGYAVISFDEDHAAVRHQDPIQVISDNMNHVWVKTVS